MCGILGIFTNGPPSDNYQLLHQSLNQISHRGPDDSGIWCDNAAGIGLGHCRLSIIDISPTGHQPMASPSGRYTITYNGEIYNFPELRKELENKGYQFRGTSDTEVLLAAIDEWGLESGLKRFNGMFAFGLWDKQERKLCLVRDRLGIKPLYYGWVNSSFIFASELKAIRILPGFNNPINRDALTLYLRHNYVPTPYSIYQHIYKLPPGTFLEVQQGSSPGSLHPKSYWSARQVILQLQNGPEPPHPSSILEQFAELLQNSVARHMISDVPLGAFLSGGIDSSTVVAIMQAQRADRVRTFSIGFLEDGFDEAKHAKAVAQHLGTDHTELYVTPQEALSVIPQLPKLYDEPFADSSQIPTYLVSKLARSYVKVSLSGDGGDELFAGYNRYQLSQSLWDRVSRVPWVGRRTVVRLLNLLPNWILDHTTSGLAPFFEKYGHPGSPSEQTRKMSEVLCYKYPEELYLRTVSHWKKPSEVVLNAHEPSTILSDPTDWIDLPDYVHRMMYLDLVTYLPDDILVKVDRASMGVGLEARVPLLDHRVVEFVWGLPLAFKLRNGSSKWLLRELLYQYIPQELVERPKMGFGVPVSAWLREPLLEWAEELLDEHRLTNEGYFNPLPIRERWIEHKSGKNDWGSYLWDVIMFQAWLEFDKK